MTDVAEKVPRKKVRAVKPNRLLQEARRAEHADEPLKNAKYEYRNGLRYVPPYTYTYNTYCKDRWIGRGLLEVFSTEFRDREVSYYQNAILKGTVRVNNEIADSECLLKNGDIINHNIHRHEPPVPDTEIKIVMRDDEEGVLVINKPAGIPVHPSGRYRHNTIIHILRYEMGIPVIASCNRLDRLTSGLVILSTKQKMASELQSLMASRGIKKEYVAKVIGEFPEEEIVCNEPIKTVSPKFGLNRVRADGGRECCTIFNRISYDGEHSIVRCRPLTGRTHQIRVHLQHLGHPIGNDSLYANPHIWGKSFEKITDVPDDDIIPKMDYIGKTFPTEAISFSDKERGVEMWSGKNCDDCGAALYYDPSPTELAIWLHAWKYAEDSGKWSYETDLPEWAKGTL